MQAAAAEKQKEAARELLKRAPAKKLAGALLNGGYQVGRPQLSVGRSQLPHLHVQPGLLWPDCAFIPHLATIAFFLQSR